MGKFEPRDPFRTPGGFMPVSDADSGGLSDPAFERRYAALPRLQFGSARPLGSPVARAVALVATAGTAILILALLLFPGLVATTVAR